MIDLEKVRTTQTPPWNTNTVVALAQAEIEVKWELQGGVRQTDTHI